MSKGTGKSHDWTGISRWNRHVHCANCGKLFQIGKAKGECPGPQQPPKRRAGNEPASLSEGKP